MPIQGQNKKGGIYNMRGLVDKLPGIFEGITAFVPKIVDIINTIKGLFAK